MPHIDDVEDRGRGDVRRDPRLRCQMLEEREHRRLAATVRRRQQREPGRVREVRVNTCMQDPQRDSEPFAVGYVDVLADDIVRECQRIELRINAGRPLPWRFIVVAVRLGRRLGGFSGSGKL
jgi:hypothetical protein